jgi:hypothetical protein
MKNVEHPKRKPWGQLVSHIRDIDGYLIELTQLCAPFQRKAIGKNILI